MFSQVNILFQMNGGVLVLKFQRIRKPRQEEAFGKGTTLSSCLRVVLFSAHTPTHSIKHIHTFTHLQILTFVNLEIHTIAYSPSIHLYIYPFPSFTHSLQTHPPTRTSRTMQVTESPVISRSPSHSLLISHSEY